MHSDCAFRACLIDFGYNLEVPASFTDALRLFAVAAILVGCGRSGFEGQGTCPLGYVTRGGACNIAPCSGSFGVTQSSTAPVYPGETVALRPTGGCPLYTVAVTGGGAVDPLTFLYTAPLDAPPSTVQLAFSDAAGARETVVLDLLGFVDEAPRSSNVTVVPSVAPGAVAAIGTSFLLTAQSVLSQTPQASAAATFVGASTASIFAGTSRPTEVDAYRDQPGAEMQGALIDARGTLVVQAIATRGAQSARVVMYVSRDAGTTWAVSTIDASPGEDVRPTALRIVTDDVYLVGRYVPISGPNAAEFNLLRCSIASASCTPVAGWNPHDSVDRIDVSDAGTIYVGGTNSDSYISSLWRSVDGGSTYTQLRTRQFGGAVYGLDVTPDGQSIVWSCSYASDPFIEYSFDSGGTWASEYNPVPAWFFVSLRFLPNLDLVASGTCFEDCGAGVRWTIDVRSFSGGWQSKLNALGSGRQLARTTDGYLIAAGAEGLALSVNDGEEFVDVQLARTAPLPLGREVKALVAASNAVYRSDLTSVTSTTARSDVSRSTDGGETWVDDDTTADGATLVGLAASSITGTVIGVGASSSPNQAWLVRRKTAGGVWSSAAAAASGAPTAGALTAIAALPDGTFVHAGYASVDDVQTWFVSRSADDGQTWTELDRFAPDATSLPSPTAVVPYRGGVVVVGVATANDFGKSWIVRAWDGAMWTSIYDDPGPGAANAAVALNDELLVAGTAGDDIATHWVTRVYSGNRWAVSDDVSMGPLLPARALTMHAFADGTVVVAGNMVDADLTQRAAARRLRDGMWRPFDLHTPYGGTTYLSIAECSTDRPCLAGSSYAPDSLAPKSMLRLLTAD